MRFLVFLLTALASVPATAQQGAPAAPLSLEQQSSLRCAAAFAMVAQGQANGDARALAFPPLAERGREYFVRFSARLMDERGLTRDQVAAMLSREAQALRDENAIDDVMPACLMLLDASGL